MKHSRPLALPILTESAVVRWIGEITGESAETIQRRLHEEYAHPGTNVSRAMQAAGLPFYEWSSALAKFYGTTDAFLYELVIWNLNKLKAWMRDAVVKYVGGADGDPKRVLCYGDGLGLDSIAIAEAGHEVTYFELPGVTEAFARRAIAASGKAITIVTDPISLPTEVFDAVVNLDVLEHVPDPPAMVRELVEYVRPGGRLIIHESFLWIHRSNPTHLRSIRRYSGSLSLFEQFDVRLVDGEIGWNPIVFEKLPNLPMKTYIRIPKLILLRMAGLFMMLGRISVLPFSWGGCISAVQWQVV